MSRTLSSGQAPQAERQSSPAHVHATAVAVGEACVLIRGPAGAGKSSLALAVVELANARGLFARIVGDDRVRLERRNGRLIARPHSAIAGQVERRGQGIAEVGHEGAAVVRCVVDLADKASGVPPRMPPAAAETATLEEVALARLVLPTGLGAAEGARILLDFLSRRRDFLSRSSL